MSSRRAVVQIDHHTARVLQLDADTAEAAQVHEHSHHTRQHGSAIRTEHEFFGHVCDALAGIDHLLVVGSRTAQSDFRHYVEKHRAPLSDRIVGWQTVDQPTQGQLLALARTFFVAHDDMAPT